MVQRDINLLDLNVKAVKNWSDKILIRLIWGNKWEKVDILFNSCVAINIF